MLTLPGGDSNGVSTHSFSEKIYMSVVQSMLHTLASCNIKRKILLFDLIKIIYIICNILVYIKFIIIYKNDI